MDFKVIDIGFELPTKKKILVVDDEAAIQTLIFDSLSEEYSLLTAHNGHEGISRAETGKPDLILMDVMMPDINGHDAVKLLNANNATNKIPVVIMTARDFDKSTINMLKSEPNVVGFISKPFRISELRNCIKAGIGKVIS